MIGPTINPILLFVGLVAFSSILAAVRRFLRRAPGITPLKLLMHVGVGCGIIIAAWFPQSARSVTQRLGFGDNLNTLIFVGFIILFIMNYFLLRALDSLEHKLSRLVQELALKDSLSS